MMNSIAGVASYGRGYVVVVSLCPRAIIVGRCIPYAATVEIEEIAGKVKIIWHSGCNIETHFWGLDENRGFLNNHRLRILTVFIITAAIPPCGRYNAVCQGDCCRRKDDTSEQ
jgi:hypothetical protein